MKVGTKNILGTDFEVHADVTGVFSIRATYTDDDGQERSRSLGRGTTLDKAVNEARAEIKKDRATLRIPFRMLDGTHGIATGRHGGHGGILIRVASERGGTQAGIADRYGRQGYLQPDTPDEVIDRLAQMERIAHEARQTREALITEYGFDLGRAVDKALNEEAKR